MVVFLDKQMKVHLFRVCNNSRLKSSLAAVVGLLFSIFSSEFVTKLTILLKAQGTYSNVCTPTF
jgi:hypothetical protein